MESLREEAGRAGMGANLIGLTVPVQVQGFLDDKTLLGTPVFL